MKLSRKNMKQHWVIYWAIAMLLGTGLFQNSYAEKPKPLPKLEIDRPAPEPAETTAEFKLRAPEKIYTRIFKTPPGAYPPNEKQKRIAKSAQQILEEAGIDFPEGSKAEYDWNTGILTVAHNPEGMLQIEAYIDNITSSALRTLQWQLEIYRLPALLIMELQQSASNQSDHTPERDAVLKLVHKNQAQLVTSLSLECRSGQRAKAADGIEHRYVDHYEWQEEGKKFCPLSIHDL